MGQAIECDEGLEISAVDAAQIEVMALTLLKKFGSQAYDIAAGFAADHRLVGDAARARNWDGVCAVLARARTLS